MKVTTKTGITIHRGETRQWPGRFWVLGLPDEEGDYQVVEEFKTYYDAQAFCEDEREGHVVYDVLSEKCVALTNEAWERRDEF